MPVILQHIVSADAAVQKKVLVLDTEKPPQKTVVQESNQEKGELEEQLLTQKQKVLTQQLKIEYLEAYLKLDEQQRLNFGKFFKTRVIAENEWLKSIASRFSPFEQIHLTEICELKC